MMKSISGFSWLVAAFLATGVSLFASEPGHSVVLEDPAGDVHDPGQDIVRLTVETTGSSLDLTIELASDVVSFLEENQAGGLVEMHLDTDNDPATGGIAYWGEEAGFEYVVKVYSCIDYENGHACAGALGGASITGYYTQFGVKRHEEGSKEANDTHDDPFWKSPRGTIEGRLVKASIPYSELGLSSGSKLRILIRESDGWFEESYFPIVEMMLK